jgi:Dihydrodipicolinate synthetase family
VPIVNGIGADGSIEAARVARMATEGGASALLVFPPALFTMGQSPEMALAHFKRIADTSDLPIIAFQYALATGQGYPRDTLLKMCKQVPTIRAINVPQHEMHIRTLQSLPRPVNVLTTHSAWLFSSLVLGCNGLLSGSGSVIADLQAALFEAVRANDLAAARALNDRIYPLAKVFCADPRLDPATPLHFSSAQPRIQVPSARRRRVGERACFGRDPFFTVLILSICENRYLASSQFEVDLVAAKTHSINNAQYLMDLTVILIGDNQAFNYLIISLFLAYIAHVPQDLTYHYVAGTSSL